MIIYDTSKLTTPESLPFSAVEQLWIYNGIDCGVTLEVLERCLPELDEVSSATYAFSRSLQGPVLDMNMRGLRVDLEKRDELIRTYGEDIEELTSQLDRIIRDGLGYDFAVSKGRKYRYPSNDQWRYIFYELLGLPAIRKRNQEGELVATTDRKALERLEGYFDAEPLVRRLLLIRDLGKKMSLLQTGIDADGRLRSSFNIAGTTTGRFSSAFSDFGTGTNIQNIEDRLRAIFIPDPGCKFGNIDLAQSDARVVGAIHWNLFRDPAYLDACESGDLHTSVARLAFPDLGWTGSGDRSLADKSFYRNFSYRDACKRLGHGTNFMGEPDHMARETHIPAPLVRRFREDYLRAFPAIELWWDWVKRVLRDTHTITTLRGRRRRFFGKADDDHTIKAAIAYEPQSVTADTINTGLLNLWLTNRVQIFAQVHDSILFQFPEREEPDIRVLATSCIEQKTMLKGDRPFTIPADWKSGYNWGSKTAANPNGLK